MQLEKTNNGEFAITFEPVVDLEFHELPVALNALGSHLVIYRSDPNVRAATANVAGVLMPLRTKDDENNSVNTAPIQLDKAELSVLQHSLHGYCDEKTLQGDIVAGAMSGNFKNPIVRTLEAGIALEMLQKIVAEIGEVSEAAATNPIGYTTR